MGNSRLLLFVLFFKKEPELLSLTQELLSIKLQSLDDAHRFVGQKFKWVAEGGSFVSSLAGTLGITEPGTTASPLAGTT